jgi:hypothetical protein
MTTGDLDTVDFNDALDHFLETDTIDDTSVDDTIVGAFSTQF